MTNIKHLTERKVEIQFDPEKKVEHLILLVYKYKADHVYDKSTNTLMIECKTDTDMLNLLEEVKKYLRKAWPLLGNRVLYVSEDFSIIDNFT